MKYHMIQLQIILHILVCIADNMAYNNLIISPETCEKHAVFLSLELSTQNLLITTITTD